MAGDVPTWITTVAVVLAAGQFLIDRKRRAAEEEREAKAQATRLVAWAVTDYDSKPRVYGVIASNTSGSTFHNVCVTTHMHGDVTAFPINLDIVPPGQLNWPPTGRSDWPLTPGEFFVRLNDPREQSTWQFSVSMASYAGHLRPYMKSANYRVIGIEFSDNLNQRWSTNEHAVVARA